MKRQKRKASSLKLNFVQPLNPKKKTIGIKRVSVLFTNRNPSNHSDPSDGNSSKFASTISAGSPDLMDDQDPPGDGLPMTTESHTQRKSKAVEVWSEIRPALLSSFTAVFGFPDHPTACVFCTTREASVWCPDCGSYSYLCVECAEKLHKSINLFHNPLLWKVGYRDVYVHVLAPIFIIRRLTVFSLYFQEE